ncbi:AMP-binding protein [Pseudooctadecabacter jejudonensis]|uniref:Putative sulfoacetate--CoA ligase n=1 Tax=Pseudooctadecabacter jejudonensis TaxID=1391910 RepID=A0A1Y5SHG7_9RHOB|nr:AMP-binding protein [Pseudooctadecabacter jejudonensis]SLN40895.1 putative sulfoacetate--CoA ligase [Pseudooctadecabacter jejudonensis]
MIFDPHAPPTGTVRDWLEARAQAGGVAIVFPETDETLSWVDLKDAAYDAAAGLVGLGVQSGESVAIVHPNGKDGVIALYAALVGGFRATMINLAAGPDAIGYALDHSQARFAFVHADKQDVIANVAPPHLQILTPQMLTTTGDVAPVSPDQHALLMYTSGTTGRPKGVVHTHASLLAGGWTTAVAHGLMPEDRGFCVLPIYHINGLCVSLMGSLVSGGSLAMTSKFSASRFWEQACATQVTWFSVVPTIISHLLHGAAEPSDAVKMRLRFGRSASSALAVETQAAFETRFGVPIIETMGLTETAAQILSNPLPPGRRKTGSPGVAIGNEVRILNRDLTDAAPLQVGEIAIRGPNVMSEYLFNPDATAKTFVGGWLRTGDLGHIDDDGYVFVTGRLKELIIKGGENIAPREIDEVLYSEPDIIEAAAFARTCKSYGETVEAAVAIKPGSDLTEDRLLALCKDRLGPFKSPDRIHFMDALPKGPSGKIQRLKLSSLI